MIRLVHAACLAAALTASLHVTSAIETAALAHSTIHSSHPANGATVPAGLSKLQFNFAKPIRITLVRITSKGAREPIAPTQKPPGGFVKTLNVEVAPLAPGTYSVLWTGISKDGHVMKNSIAFTVTTN